LEGRTETKFRKAQRIRKPSSLLQMWLKRQNVGRRGRESRNGVVGVVKT